VPERENVKLMAAAVVAGGGSGHAEAPVQRHERPSRPKRLGILKLSAVAMCDKPPPSAGLRASPPARLPPAYTEAVGSGAQPASRNRSNSARHSYLRDPRRQGISTGSSRLRTSASPLFMGWSRPFRGRSLSSDQEMPLKARHSAN